TALDGHNLRDGSLVTTANQFRDESAPFDVDRLRLAIGASVATLYGNVGVTDRVEVGFAAPVVSLVIDGSRVNTYRSRQFTQATAHGRTVGLADVVVRTKVTAYREDRTALAAAVDVRLPTGRTEDLLGAGSASVKLSAIGSVESARLSSHANAGVTIGGRANGTNHARPVALPGAPPAAPVPH